MADPQRHAAKGSSFIHPAGVAEMHPSLVIGLVHIFHLNAADGVRQIMILGRRHRIRQMLQAQFIETREKFVVMFTAKGADYTFPRNTGAPAFGRYFPPGCFDRPS